MKFIPLRTLRDYVKENGLNREILAQVGVVQELNSASEDTYYNDHHGFPKGHCVIVTPSTDETIDLSKVPTQDFKEALNRIIKPFTDSYTEYTSERSRAGDVYTKMHVALNKVNKTVRRYSQVSRVNAIDKILSDVGLTDEQLEQSITNIGRRLRDMRDEFRTIMSIEESTNVEF